MCKVVRTDRNGHELKAGDIFFKASAYNPELMMLRQTENGLYADYMERSGAVRTMYFDSDVDDPGFARMERAVYLGNVFEDPTLIYLFARLVRPCSKNADIVYTGRMVH